MTVYYVDGAFVSSDKAMIPVDDLAVLRGIGICDIMRTFHKKPYFVEEHIDRLMASGKKIGLALPWSRAQIRQIVFDTLDKNPGLEEVNIRIVITGGSSPDFLTPTGRPRLIVMVTPIKKLPDEWYTQGVKVITSGPGTAPGRGQGHFLYPGHHGVDKGQSRRGHRSDLYRPEPQRPGRHTPATCSYFSATPWSHPPSDGILKGITRKVILSLARDRFEVKEAALPLEKQLTADEVFIHRHQQRRGPGGENR